MRMKILKTLYECPMNMKEINYKTKINYSAISNIVHKLELDGYIYRENNYYFLSNTMKVCMGNVFDLEDLMLMMEDLFPIIQNHNVNFFPKDSLCNFHYLKNIHLVESNGVDAYMVYSLISNSIKNVKKVQVMLPFSYDEFNNGLNNVLSKNRSVHIITPTDIKDILVKNLDTSNHNLKLEYFNGNSFNYFLLICTDKKMILGFFRDNGAFDLNRILISSDKFPSNCSIAILDSLSVLEFIMSITASA